MKIPTIFQYKQRLWGNSLLVGIRNRMEKKYYILQKETYGVYPQVDCLSIFQAQQISSWKMFPGVKPKLSFRLKNKAKFTDVLSSTAGPATDFLINSKVKDILDGSHIMQHQFFEASVRKNNQEYEYHWLHLSQPNLIDALSFEESEFRQTEWELINKGPIKIRSYDHYMELKAHDKEGAFGVSLDKIVMTEKFDRSLDMFFLLPFDFNVYVSETLNETLESSGIKGIGFPRSVMF